ncbi:MAG: helix-turn-helix transcriptional regulator [Pseudomonadota bacterium]
MTTRSPTELVLKNAPPPGSRPAGFATVTWEARSTFGPYLRGLRDAARLSLRAASDRIGVSFSYLAKMETGERASPPTIKVLDRMAVVYGRDLREIMHEAGFRFETPAELQAMTESVDARFLRLVTDSRLRPMRMDAVVIELIPPLVKRQWIEFASKLETCLVGGTATVDEILRGKDEGTSAERPAPAHGPTRPAADAKSKRGKP